VSELQALLTGWLTELAAVLPFGFAFGVGMVAAVNPCGFAMLPAYLSLPRCPRRGLRQALLDEPPAAGAPRRRYRLLGVRLALRAGRTCHLGGRDLAPRRDAGLGDRHRRGAGLSGVLDACWADLAYGPLQAVRRAGGQSQERKRAGLLPIRPSLRGGFFKLHPAGVLSRNREQPRLRQRPGRGGSSDSRWAWRQCWLRSPLR
jgi:hypothetical protein